MADIKMNQSATADSYTYVYAEDASGNLVKISLGTFRSYLLNINEVKQLGNIQNDLNNYNYECRGYVVPAAPNNPSGAWGMLVSNAISSAGGVQLFFDYFNANKFYVRTWYEVDAFTPWHQVSLS